MERGVPAAIAAIACSTVIALAAAQTVAPQKSPQSTPQNPYQPSERDYVVIGCVSSVEETSRPASGSAAAEAAAAPAIIITDTRATPPSKYRLDGEADELRRHIGHTVEVAGPITSASSARGAAAGSRSMPTLKVRSVTYISTTCAK
jgi:hypothetical protein